MVGGRHRPTHVTHTALALATMQSPLIALPLKETREVELEKPLAALIQTVYEQHAESFSEDLERVEQTRKDATDKASGDETARDLLFSWFHMLEMLELRFPELRTSFTWREAFSMSEVTQQALAYEKASVIFNCAARISAVGMHLDRRDAQSDGVKRSYAAFRQAAGFLDYIQSNFMHAPSKDLSSKFVQSLKTLMLVQAAEIFLEKSIADKKGPALVAKLASHVAGTYTSLYEEWQDSNMFGSIPSIWRCVIMYKSKHVASIAQFYCAHADDAAGAHGTALARFHLAEKLAKEACRLVGYLNWFNYQSLLFVSTLPSDTTAAASAEVKAHAAVVAEACRAAEKDNDLVYHEVQPSEDALPAIDATNVTTPIPIRETFAMPDVQRVLGADIFPTLVPLSVHESASMYSEEQAKLVRAETERVESANEELQAALASMDLPKALLQYDALEGRAATAEPSASLLDDAQIVAVGRPVASIEQALARLTQPQVADELLADALADLDEENRTCERLRVEHAHRWTQEPLGSVARTLRRDLTSHRDALRQAQEHDKDLAVLWASVQDDVALLQQGPDAVRGAVQRAAQSAQAKGAPSLVDLDEGEADPQRDDAVALLQQTRATLDRVRRLPKQRTEQLQELKTRVRGDDISRVLLLNRRIQNIEPKVFAAELAKYTPLQSQLVDSVVHQNAMLDELRTSLQKLSTHPGTAPVRKQRNASALACAELEQRLTRAFDAFSEVCAVLDKASSFYAELRQQAERLNTETARLLAERRAERQTLAQSLAWDQAGGAGAAPAARSPAHPGIEPAGASAYGGSGSSSIADDLRALQLEGGAPGYGSRSYGGASPPRRGAASPSAPYAAPPSWPAPPASYTPKYASGQARGDRPAPPPRPPRV